MNPQAAEDLHRRLDQAEAEMEELRALAFRITDLLGGEERQSEVA